MKRELILASQSPRRRELLERCHVAFRVEVADIDEALNPDIPLEAAMEELAWRKAHTVFERHPEAVVIGADTIVVLERQILGKPKDVEEAKAMLSRLSGKTHQVMTGVCLLSADQRVCFSDVSDVEFYPLTAEEIDAYVATGEPLDKAGAYGIQGELAWRKAYTMFERYPEAVVIGADTIVVLERQILGKPRNVEEAKAMLSRLSGKTHQVMTGVCVLSADQRVCFCDVSDVEFYPLTVEEIDAYVATGEPLDKAGAYGIQGEGFFLVKKITGDFYSIMGFPVARVLRALKKFDF